jgi:F-type H+-transporting ATPase subunit b
VALIGAPERYRNPLCGGPPVLAAPGQRMNIIPDPLQVLLNTFPFLVAVVGMYRIILKPMLGYLLERDAAIKGGHTEAARIEGEIADRMAEYEARLAAARDEIGTLRADKRAVAQGQYDVAIEAARAEAEVKIAAANGEIAAAKDAAANQLKTMSGEIADQVAGQVLGRSISAGA